MKILFFIDSLRSGGKERRLTELMKMLKLKKDIQFELIVMSSDIHYKEIFDLDINLYYLLRKTKKDLSVFKRFYEICKLFKPDFIHCWDSMTAIYAIPASKLLNIALINGMITDAPLKQNIFNTVWFRAKLTFPFSNLIIGNSKAGLTAYRAPQKKSFYIYNGFNFQRSIEIIESEKIREELNINTKFIVGMVASFSKLKDYETYFAAAQSVLKKRNDITFLAIGSDTDSESSKNLINNNFLQNFRFLGKKSNIESFINAMDICILSTFSEGISNSILEYMALGKPVIATAGGGTDELIKDKCTGFLISPSNSNELAEKIEILLNDTSLRAELGTAGKERIQNYFSIELMVERYISICKNFPLKKTNRILVKLDKSGL